MKVFTWKSFAFFFLPQQKRRWSIARQSVKTCIYRSAGDICFLKVDTLYSLSLCGCDFTFNAGSREFLRAAFIPLRSPHTHLPSAFYPFTITYTYIFRSHQFSLHTASTAPLDFRQRSFNGMLTSVRIAGRRVCVTPSFFSPFFFVIISLFCEESLLYIFRLMFLIKIINKNKLTHHSQLSRANNETKEKEKSKAKK